MSNYRPTRGIEASVIDFLTQELSNTWKNIRVEKTFAHVYGLNLDANKHEAAVCVRVLSSKTPRLEIGDNTIWRTALVMIDVFATSDGQREDLKDFIISKVIKGIPYYQYTIKGSEILSKIQTGRLRITIEGDVPVNFNTDKSSLAVSDRFRHALSFSATMSQVEG